MVELYNLSSLDIVSGSTSYGYVGYYAVAIHTSATAPSAIVTQGDFVYCTTETEKVVIGYNGDKGISKLVIPEGTTAIGNYLITWNFSIEEIVLPDGIKSIGYNAFSGCMQLKTINIPEGVKVIRQEAFNSCSRLKNLVLPDSIEFIDTYAFINAGLETVTIGSGVTTIGDAAFGWCTSLTAVYYNGSQEDWNNVNKNDIGVSETIVFFKA